MYRRKPNEALDRGHWNAACERTGRVPSSLSSAWNDRLPYSRFPSWHSTPRPPSRGFSARVIQVWHHGATATRAAHRFGTLLRYEKGPAHRSEVMIISFQRAQPRFGNQIAYAWFHTADHFSGGR